MTKIEYIDFIRNSLRMADKTAKYHPTQVDAAINVAVNTVFYEVYAENKQDFMKQLERYTTIVTSTPALHATLTSRYHSTLTVDVVDLPRKTGGIIEITTATGTTTKFVPISTIEGEQLYGSEASLNGAEVGFSYTGARDIEYWGMSATEATSGVVIRLIKQFMDYANTDNVKLPFGQDERIIELVRQYLGAIPPKDLINDNRDLIPQANG